MPQIERIVIATGNQAKVDRYKSAFENVAREIRGLTQEEKAEKPEETGGTAEENAKIKAIFYSRLIEAIVFSEDESLFVEFLPKDKQPGVHVRRINGRDDASDSELLKYWAELVQNAPENKRTGHWHVAYCLATPLGTYRTFVQDRPIRFYYPPSVIGIPGWPLSSIQGSTKFDKPSSEYTRTERMVANSEANAIIRAGLKKMINSLKKSGKAVNYIK